MKTGECRAQLATSMEKYRCSVLPLHLESHASGFPGCSSHLLDSIRHRLHIYYLYRETPPEHGPPSVVSGKEVGDPGVAGSPPTILHYGSRTGNHYLIDRFLHLLDV